VKVTVPDAGAPRYVRNVPVTVIEERSPGITEPCGYASSGGAINQNDGGATSPGEDGMVSPRVYGKKSRKPAEFGGVASWLRPTTNCHAPGDRKPGGKVTEGGGAGIGIACAPGAAGATNQNTDGEINPGGIPSITPAALIGYATVSA
jgi:hypothetical protein